MPTRVTVALLALFLLVFSVVIRGAGAGSGLTATADSQRIQNRQADAQHLSRMVDVAMVRKFRRLGLLVPVRTSTSTYYLHAIPARLRYLRPWSRQFLTRLSRQFYSHFHTRLRVTGLIRTAHFQQRLDVVNANAAAASGPERSSHLTGATLDISKRFMPRAGQRWMRRVLSQLRAQGVLYAIEEYHQPCFHVMVYRNYLDYVEQIS
jgi:hypothetical protein